MVISIGLRTAAGGGLRQARKCYLQNFPSLVRLHKRDFGHGGKHSPASLRFQHCILVYSYVENRTTIEELQKPLSPIEAAELVIAAKKVLTQEGMALLRRLVFAADAVRDQKSEAAITPLHSPVLQPGQERTVDIKCGKYKGVYVLRRLT
jgi:hypothetical protein